MKTKSFLAFFPCLLSLAGCFEGVGGGIKTISASSLPSSPVTEARSFEACGYTFYYWRVYKDEHDNFVLKDRYSYIINCDMNFGLRFASSGVARAYELRDGAADPVECDLMQEKEGELYYSLLLGFKIQIDPHLSVSYEDINIGKLKHWC